MPHTSADFDHALVQQFTGRSGVRGFPPLRLSKGSRLSAAVSRLPRGVVFRVVVALLRDFQQLAVLGLTGVLRSGPLFSWPVPTMDPPWHRPEITVG